MNRALSHRAASSSSSTATRPSVSPAPTRKEIAAFQGRRSPHSPSANRTATIKISTSTPPRRCSHARRASNEDNDSAPSPSSIELSEDVWALKPAWCQPYSIVATGVFVVGGAKVVGGVWLALAAAAAVSVWWWAFLIEYPVAYRDYVRGTKHAGGYAKSIDSAESEES